MKLRSGCVYRNMDNSDICDAVNNLFKLFKDGENLMLSHENAEKVKLLVTAVNTAYDTLNSLCAGRDTSELPENYVKLEIDTKYWVFKQSVQTWFSIDIDEPVMQTSTTS